MAFLTGTPKMTLHYIQSFATNKKSHETKDLQIIIFCKIEDYHLDVSCTQEY